MFFHSERLVYDPATFAVRGYAPNVKQTSVIANSLMTVFMSPTPICSLNYLAYLCAAGWRAAPLLPVKPALAASGNQTREQALPITRQ